ncbi:MAG: S9 family peptidase [Prolixibacteraceae bacterium]|jgi:dipeptidyl aminopeptidase/acylaminoacyl peptidase|nr:S9 family peptidase [Prolixibacteraceae bacterium]
MKKTYIFLLIISAMIMVSCNEKNEIQKGITPEIPELKSDRLTPEVMWQLGRIGGENVSPDGSRVLFSVTNYKIEDNKGYKDWYIYNIEDETIQRITNTNINEQGVVWHPGGETIGFISDESGSNQLWEMDTNGSKRRQISFLEGGINDFKYAPDGSKVLFSKAVKLDDTVNDLYPDLPKANARIETDLMYRHWDSWHDYTYNHIFVADYDESGIHEAADIMEGERFDSPMKPFGGMEQIAWSPNAKTIAYTCKKKTGKEYSFSTNSEIWFYDIEKKTTRNFTEGIMGYDVNPVFSPTGKHLAWKSMERDGYESDQARLFVANVESGKRRNLFSDFEESAASITWSQDEKTIFFISDIQASDEIFKIDMATAQIERITNGIHNYKSVQFARGKILTRKQSMSQPDELYLVNIDNGEDTAITQVNEPILEQLTMGVVEKRWVKTTDNKDMLVWVIYPPHFDPSKKYPALLYCQGGPQGTVSQFWSYRWNFQLMAANDYIIVAPNRRGLPGFGMEWLEQISTDYGGQNIDDYISAIDAVSAEPYVDETRLGAVGASYGGFSVFYLAGHHQKRFSAFVSHAGIFNFEQMYATTEEMWFVDWDLGGSYWDKENKTAQHSYSFSPHKFVGKWDTPILVIHGENDYRIPFTQGMAAYNSAVMRGIPAQYLHYHNENHWILKPQNGLLWHRTYFKWLDKWLK